MLNACPEAHALAPLRFARAVEMWYFGSLASGSPIRQAGTRTGTTSLNWDLHYNQEFPVRFGCCKKMFCVRLSIVANPTINNPAILNCLIFWPHIYGVFYLNVWKFGLSGVKICGVNYLDINTDLSALNVALVVVGLAPSWHNVFNTFHHRSIQIQVCFSKTEKHKIAGKISIQIWRIIF